ncbi:CYFA0S02e09142g1_1 [Cyberlindnera fabianii]|uniref:Glutamyl-tRNA(Gln) amidotransferase subunit B, mitochondrial n=1 Tax=Cyberlindnera fabianii TaxID=36022 RepID=A0A061AN20_CYBFA|nr:CYFA0S02e09142g1_1 [Cyberlindnera fabianii]
MLRSLTQRRLFSSSVKTLAKNSAEKSPYKLKCGLEIHSQLRTPHKLFSLSSTSFLAEPNSKISYYDASLPGTQPKLNPEALKLALRAAVALGSEVNLNSTFDRKHYFYGDQPTGYQITQHYEPYAKGGEIKLFKRDGIKEDEKIIRIEQIQLEQDTGKSVYTESETEKFSKIDLNRTNTPLIEMVTKPDFTDPEEVKVFIKKFQNLLRHLEICTGDLETGAMRVDVNISVSGGERVELKNLSTTSAVISAIKYEFKRQVDLIKKGESAVQETRGWDGKRTVRLRTKEDALDYRYMPDPELPPMLLDVSVVSDIRDTMPETPDEVLTSLMAEPYSLSLKDATILTYDLELLKYYRKLFHAAVDEHGVDRKTPGNWLIHELLGTFSRNNMPFDPDYIPLPRLVELMILVQSDYISNYSAKLLLQHLFNNKEEAQITLKEVIEEYGLAKLKAEDISKEELIIVCQSIMDEQPKTVKSIKKGKINGLNFLVGQAMKETQGRIEPHIFENTFKELLKC